MRRLVLIGVCHKTAPMALREQIAMTPKQATRFGTELIASEVVDEAVVVSTCNRTEVYAAVDTGDTRTKLTEIAARMAHHASLDGAELSKVAYTRAGTDVARHLYGVTAGLESMVIGESEIQGQIKRALESALAGGTTGPLTSRLFSTALKAGKRVRSETAIGAARTSIASVAVDLAVKVVGPLERRSVVMIGTGEIGSQAARALAARGSRTTFIANRRVDRAEELADLFGGAVAPLSDLPMQIELADVIVSATTSPHTIIGADELQPLMERRAERQLALIDLALPRDIELGCHNVAGVSMYDLDDLQRIVDATFVARDGERDAAGIVIEQEVERFEQWLARRSTARAGGEVRELFGNDDDRRRSLA